VPRNKRVAKELKTYNLRITPTDYEIIQQQAAANGIPMNTLLQKIIAEFTNSEKVTPKEQKVLDEIKSLPLKKRKAIIKELSADN